MWPELPSVYTRNEILDPAEVMGPDYPTETFRVLKATELCEHNEYRTQRAWSSPLGIR